MKTTPPSWRRYSNTPTVATAIKPSLPGRLSAAAYRIALLSASLLLLADGYPVLAAIGLLPALWLCWPAGQRPGGIRGENGQWLFHLAGRWCEVEIVGPVFSPPWMLVLRWRRVGEAEGAPHWLYLWPDSLAAGQWRALRRALVLQGGVGRHQDGVTGVR